MEEDALGLSPLNLAAAAVFAVGCTEGDCSGALSDGREREEAYLSPYLMGMEKTKQYAVVEVILVALAWAPPEPVRGETFCG